MPILKPEDLIEKYIRENLSPTQEERDMISARYEELSGILKGVNFQSGSYARFTAITPVNDLDVIWEVDAKDLAKVPSVNKLRKSIDPIELDMANVLHDLASCLDFEFKKIGNSVRIEPRTHSVCVFYGKTDEEFSIDIVPAISSGDINEYGDQIYLVPEIVKLSKDSRTERYSDTSIPIKWIRSDPKGYIECSRELNEKNENFRKVAKFVKTWKYFCKEKNPELALKSFHLELIVSEIFNQDINIDVLGGISSFFEQLRHFVDAPCFVDRANAGRYIDEYLTEMNSSEVSAVSNFLANAAVVVEKMKSLTNYIELEKLMKEFIVIKQSHSTLPDVAPPRIVEPYSRPHSW